MNNIFNQVTILFLIMTIGYVSRKRGILNSEITKGLTEILLNVTAPILTISSFQFNYSHEMLVGAGMVLAFAIIMHILTIFLGKCLFWHIIGDTSKVLRFTTIFTNSGFMGYPIIGSIFGQQGIFFASIYCAINTTFIWTYGIFIFKGKTEQHYLTNVFLNPGIISVLIGMLLFLLSLKLPLPLFQTMQTVGSMTTPLSMIIVGSNLVDVKLKELFTSWLLCYGAIVRLILIPILVLICLKCLNMQRDLLGVCVLTVAMPAAATTVSFAEHNNGNTLFATRMVFLTTILSILTIPFVIGLL